MKKLLAVEVDCGKVTCGDCDWLNAHGGSCDMFEESLEDDCVRSPRCLAAEAKATDMMLNTAIAKANVIKTATPEGATE